MIKHFKSGHPYLTQEGKDREQGSDQYVANMCDGAVAGFKYFDLRETSKAVSYTHLLEEKDVEAYGSMKKVMEELPNNTFALCNNCYYVNLYYVTSVEGYLVSIGEIQLQISHPRKKSFMKALNDYVGGCSA